jgi:carbonic anhydrase
MKRIKRSYKKRENNIMDMDGKVDYESIMNIRKVKYMGKEYKFREIYMEKIVENLVEEKKKEMEFESVFELYKDVK